MLDDGHVYEARLCDAMQRLRLCSEIYQQPKRGEDQARMIIEQVEIKLFSNFSFHQCCK